jgi:hypothetical protein
MNKAAAISRLFRRNDSRIWAWPILAIALLLALGLSLSHFGEALQDDAYISFIYARNFARGAGFVYNVGEPAVEGYTNFLWTAMIGFAIRIGLDPVVFVQVAGIGCALGAVLLTYLLARAMEARAIVAAAAALLLASKQTLAIEAVGGLETTLFALLVLAGILPRLRAERRRRDDLLSSLALALAALTRPEGILVFGLLEAVDGACAAVRRHNASTYLRSLAYRTVPFAVIVGMHVAWRYATYGGLLPNTFHAKLSPGLSAWTRGLDYSLTAVLFFGPFLFLLPYALIGLRKACTARWACLLISTIFVAYVIFMGGDFKPSFRYLLAIMPLWCALAATALDSLGRRLTGGGSVRGAAWAAVLLLLVGGIGSATEYLYHPSWSPAVLARHQHLLAAGRKLDEMLPPDAWIAVSNAGRLPYHANRRTIDMLGLNDVHIAHQPVREDAPDTAGHEKGDGRYVLARAPDVILFINLEVLPQPLAQQSNWPQIVRTQAAGVSEQEILIDGRFARDYRLHSVPLPEVSGYLNFFARKAITDSIQLSSQRSKSGSPWPSSGGNTGGGAVPGFSSDPRRPKAPKS